MIRFDDFSLHVTGQLEIGSFQGSFEIDPWTGKVNAIWLDAWNRQDRTWKPWALPLNHYLFAPMSRELECAYAEKIADYITEYFSASEARNKRADDLRHSI